SGLSFATEKNPEFLTGAVNAIPGITARDKSTIRMDLETAATFPNPNTKNAIYVDDMEGTAEVSSFGITRRQWDPMSIPQLEGALGEVDPSNRYEAVQWYNPDYRDNARNVFREDLNPDLAPEEGDNKIPVLEVALENGTIGTGEAQDAWGGIMRLVSKTGLDLKDRKFFEVWVNDFDLGRGKMHVDMGLLGEDMMWDQVAPDGLLNSEDRNQDGVLDDSGNEDPLFDEDTGFDGLFDGDETGSGGDPAGDNYDYDENNENDFSRINGPEGNGFLDTEDLNNNGDLDRERSYYRFTIDFETRENNVGTGSTVGPKNWRLYRIPLALAEPTAIASQPTYDQGIKYVRIWFEDLDTTSARFQIASLEVTGNRWLESGIQDTTGRVLAESELGPLELFASGTINNKDEQEYQPPPVEIRVQNQVPEREQSLLIQYQNLEPGHNGSVFRALFEDEDYTRYENLEFWLRKEEPQRDTDPYPAFYFRFGGDSLNFYEVIDTLNSYYEPSSLANRAPWRLWNLDLAELTQVKLSEDVDSTMLFGRMVPVRSMRSGRYLFRAVGEPSMRKVRRLTFGLSNPSRGDPVSGILWVDDLRLTNVKGDAGFAARIGTEVKFSDFASISADFRIQDKEFRRVAGGGSSNSSQEENPRSGSDDTDLSLRGNVNFSKFMEGIGVNAPLGWGWSRSVKKPELKTASDIVLDDPSLEKTQKNSRTMSLSLNRNRKSKSSLLYYTLDNMDVRLGLDRSESVNPTSADTTSSNSVAWSYRYSPRFNSQLQIFRSWKIDPLPRSGSINAERRATERKRIDIRSETVQINTDRVSRSSYSFAMQPLTSSQLKTDFNFSSARDHIYGQPFSFAEQLNKGLETSRSHEANVSYTPGFRGLSWLSPRFSYNTKFVDDQPPTQRALVLQRDEATGETDTLSDRRIHNVRNNNSTRMDFTLGVGRLFSALPGGGDGGKGPGGGRGRGPGGGQGGRPPRDDGKGDTGDDKDSTRARGPGVGRILSPVKNLGSRIGDITGSVNLVKQSNFADLIGRPGFGYQFGLEEEIDEALQFRRGGQVSSSSSTRDLQIRGSSSVKLVRGMNLRFSYNSSNKRNRQTTNTSASRTVTWPDLQYSWDGLEELWQLKRFFKSSSLSIGYTQRKDQGGKTLDRIETERISKRWDPLLQVEAEWINKLKSQISVDKSEEINRRFLGSTSENVARGLGFNGSLSFQRTSRKRVNIPILGKGRKGSTYNATTTFRLAFRYASSKEEEQNPYRLEQHTRDISVTPSVQWSWLQNLSGNLELRFGERRNLKNENQSTRTIGASISALFKF
ncbi:MAG: cell surface protein SprA, partial [Gemmatimonadetes bacterium]|nr:cell surface protein SprA [Gemmatimonadota bacterium]